MAAKHLRACVMQEPGWGKGPTSWEREINPDVGLVPVKTAQNLCNIVIHEGR